jgi:MoxR-like ATPase
MSDPTRDWWVYRGDGKPHDPNLPQAPPWRRFGGAPRAKFQIDDAEIDLVNAALLLRRPLLITGVPGVGKSSLIHAVAHELRLGEVLAWPINTRSKLQNGLYDYDAIGRFQEEQARGWDKPTPDDTEQAYERLGQYVKLGPLGEAFLPSDRPRAVLIDEIDKSDIDLPNDLLNIFEEGWFEIPALSRAPWPTIPVRRGSKSGGTIEISGGRVTATEFPFVVMTSNGERDFPQAFLRRCIRLPIEKPSREKLANIVEAHLRGTSKSEADLLQEFFENSQKEDLATDQLLNALYLTAKLSVNLRDKDLEKLKEALFKSLK